MNRADCPVLRDHQQLLADPMLGQQATAFLQRYQKRLVSCRIRLMLQAQVLLDRSPGHSPVTLGNR